MGKLSNSAIGLVVESLIEFFQFMYSDTKRWYRHSIALMSLLAAAGGLVAVTLDMSGMRGKSTTFQQKIERLNDTEAALKEIGQFVQEQRSQMNESQKVVESLRREHETLQPMVEADKQKVNAILAAYAEAQSWSIWKERSIGFVSGVLASILATVICGTAVILWRKRKPRPA